MLFIETKSFTKHVSNYLNADEYHGLQLFLHRYPDKGNVIRGSGGVRKLRWASSGKGKSGGVRVIYYFKSSKDEIWMLTIYGKSERDIIPSHILRKIAEEINYG